MRNVKGFLIHETQCNGVLKINLIKNYKIAILSYLDKEKSNLVKDLAVNIIKSY